MGRGHPDNPTSRLAAELQAEVVKAEETVRRARAAYAQVTRDYSGCRAGDLAPGPAGDTTMVPRDLFVRYMARLLDCVGYAYLPSRPEDDRTDGGAPTTRFTKDEWLTLRAIEDEAQAQR